MSSVRDNKQSASAQLAEFQAKRGAVLPDNHPIMRQHSTMTAGEFTEYDAYLKLFTEAMRYKLRVNSYKGFIGDVPVADLLGFLKKEVEELEEALARNNHVEAMLEGADIANFAFGIMMSVMRSAGRGV